MIFLANCYGWLRVELKHGGVIVESEDKNMINHFEHGFIVNVIPLKNKLSEQKLLTVICA